MQVRSDADGRARRRSGRIGDSGRRSGTAGADAPRKDRAAVVHRVGDRSSGGFVALMEVEGRPSRKIGLSGRTPRVITAPAG
ncbi:hypothetical protein GCM10027187_57840 [Streptosporangium sandarakinum]